MLGYSGRIRRRSSSDSRSSDSGSGFFLGDHLLRVLHHRLDLIGSQRSRRDGRRVGLLLVLLHGLLLHGVLLSGGGSGLRGGGCGGGSQGWGRGSSEERRGRLLFSVLVVDVRDVIHLRDRRNVLLDTMTVICIELSRMLTSKRNLNSLLT